MNLVEYPVALADISPVAAAIVVVTLGALILAGYIFLSYKARHNPESLKKAIGSADIMISRMERRAERDVEARIQLTKLINRRDCLKARLVALERARRQEAEAFEGRGCQE